MICLYCKEELTWVNGRGWVHKDGGSYKVRCRTCGWMGAPYPSPMQCPQCGSKDIRDDHCAWASYEK